MLRLDQFFRVSQEIELPRHNGNDVGEKVVIRVLSDIEMNARQTYALARSVEVTKELKNTESDEYRLRVAPLEYASDDQLLYTLLQSRQQELAREATEFYRIDVFPYPDNASEQERIETELHQQQHEAEVLKLRAKYVADNLKNHEEKLRAWTHEQLLKTAQERAVYLAAAVAGIDAETYYTLHCALETIEGTKRFASPDEVQKLPPKLVNFLIEQYRIVDAADPWELTKSEPARTPDGLGQNDSVRKRKSKRTTRR